MKKSFHIFLLLAAGIMLSCSEKKDDAGFTVPFEKYALPNGLTVILHEDKSDPDCGCCRSLPRGLEP